MRGIQSSSKVHCDSRPLRLPRLRVAERSPAHRRGRKLTARSGFRRSSLGRSFDPARFSGRAPASILTWEIRGIIGQWHAVRWLHPANVYWVKSKLTDCIANIIRDGRVERESVAATQRTSADQANAISKSTPALKPNLQARWPS